MVRQRMYMTIATAFLVTSFATNASACAMHKTCENAMKGMLEGVIGSSCTVAAATVGAECELAMAELFPEQTLICGGAAGAIEAVCVGSISKNDINSIADKTCKPVKGC
jgi:hypothetical protein